jgi:hypothetical protein
MLENWLVVLLLGFCAGCLLVIVIGLIIFWASVWKHGWGP